MKNFMKIFSKFLETKKINFEWQQNKRTFTNGYGSDSQYSESRRDDAFGK